jgi:hypothetical protein
MSLENPAIKISDWQNMTNRLATLEAVLGMTNKSVLADAAGDLSSGIFIFDGQTAATGDVKIIVQSQVIEKLDTTGLFTQVKFTFPELAGTSWKVYPVVGAVRAIDYSLPGGPKQFLRATLEGGPAANGFYSASDQVLVKVFLQDTTSADLPPKGTMKAAVTLVAFCVRG